MLKFLRSKSFLIIVRELDFVENGKRKGENVYVAKGQTVGGRYLVCFYIHKLDGQALILSARDMTATERRLYERK